MATVLERTILVEGISFDTDDAEELEDKLTIHFSKRENGGGDIEKVVCSFGGSLSRALIVFESQDGKYTLRIVERTFVFSVNCPRNSKMSLRFK